MKLKKNILKFIVICLFLICSLSCCCDEPIKDGIYINEFDGSKYIIIDKQKIKFVNISFGELDILFDNSINDTFDFTCKNKQIHVTINKNIKLRLNYEKDIIIVSNYKYIKVNE